MFRYHVTFGVEKKIVSTADNSTLNDVIRQEFSADNSTPFVLQSWDGEFEDWVNVPDVTQLPDKCKLQVVVQGEHGHGMLFTTICLFSMQKNNYQLLTAVFTVNVINKCLIL